MQPILAYVVALVLFLALDMVWLGLVGRTFYAARIGNLLLDRPRRGVATLFYLLYVAGLVYFAVLPGLHAAALPRAAFDGALLGFFCYMTYDLTNLSTVRGFDAGVAVVDIAWGTVLSGAVAAAAVWVTRAVL